ncbi:PAS domain-containing protein [Desulfonatronospira thiodismutans]|uniref:PAS domain-containing protein n=1 Tax=Desulfonatronospira thiodismutans TaxID=488939 RepID=UPI001375FE9A|nr:PAS domain-containing protein [Desulfonatronospira thiodismutans]
MDAVVQGQSMLVGVVLKDAQDRYIHWNKKASEVFGIGIDELKRMTLLTISRGVPAREV